MKGRTEQSTQGVGMRGVEFVESQKLPIVLILAPCLITVSE